MIPARVIATKVFPPPESVLGMGISLGPPGVFTNCRLGRMVREVSAMSDFGFLSISIWEMGISFLYMGTMPRMPMLALDSLAMSCSDVMLSCMMYWISTISRHTTMPRITQVMNTMSRLGLTATGLR